MTRRSFPALLTACLLLLPIPSGPAAAENQMGYQLLSAGEASALPKGGGRLGLNVGRAQQIESGGLSFELLRVNSVAAGSPAAAAGFKAGDQVIAVDGKVFPSVAAFASYIGSLQPDRTISVDYMPPNGGPQAAQRIKVVLGDGHIRDPGVRRDEPKPAGMSTGEKLAIGVGAAALFGCYKVGCFSHKAGTNAR